MKQSASLWRQVFRHLGAREHSLLAGTLVCTLAGAGCLAASPLLLGRLTDRLLAPGTGIPPELAWLGLAYLAAIALPRFCDMLSLYLQSLLRLHANRSLLARYFGYLCAQGEQFFLKRNSGELSQEITQASNDLYIVVRNLAASIVAPLVQIGVAAAVLAASGNLPVAALIALYIAGFLANNIGHNYRLVERKRDFMEAGRRSYATLADSIANIDVARQFNGFGVLLARYRAVLDRDLRSQQRYWAISLSMQFINGLLFVGLFGASILLALHGVLHEGRSVGNFVLVGAYTLTLLAPIEALGHMFSEINQSLQTFGDFVEKLSVAPAPRRAPAGRAAPPIPPAAGIAFEHVWFAYPNSTRPALRNVSFRIAPGQRVALVGPSGSGKTTIAKLLAGRYAPERGRVSLRGTDLAELEALARNDRIAYLSQDVLVFKDSLRFNLLIAKPAAGDDELLDALDKAGLGDLPSSLPGGLDTLLGDRGATLSGGQRQRLALARLFLRTPEVIVVDEGTSSLDAVTEQRIVQQILTRFATQTIIMITHRPGAIMAADTVAVMADGQLADFGPRGELLSRNTFLAHTLGGCVGADGGPVREATCSDP